ncbi:MAG: flippase-like domain-containing protein [Anaerolineae bacterium]|nr:flippase-like domain-containing protein [Anaerolineae bacterium]
MQKYHRLILIGILFGVLVFIVIALLGDASQMAQYAQSYPWLIMLPVLLLRFANYTLRFLKWHFYLDLVGVKGVSYRDSAAIFLTGMPLAASPGKAAEILKSFILKNLYGAPIASTLPVVAAERMSDGVAVIILTAIALLNLPGARQYWIVVPLSAIPFVLTITLLQFRGLCIKVLDRLSRLPVIGKYARHFEHFYESSYKIVQWRSVILTASLGFVANFLDSIGVFVILLGFGLQPTVELFFLGMLAISLSVIAGSASGLPGGIGASDLTIGAVLLAFVFPGDPAKAGFAALLMRFVQFWFGVMVGSIVAFFYRKRLFPPSLEMVIAEEEQRREAISLSETV